MADRKEKPTISEETMSLHEILLTIAASRRYGRKLAYFTHSIFEHIDAPSKEDNSFFRELRTFEKPLNMIFARFASKLAMRKSDIAQMRLGILNYFSELILEDKQMDVTAAASMWMIAHLKTKKFKFSAKEVEKIGIYDFVRIAQKCEDDKASWIQWVCLLAVEDAIFKFSDGEIHLMNTSANFRITFDPEETPNQQVIFETMSFILDTEVVAIIKARKMVSKDKNAQAEYDLAIQSFIELDEESDSALEKDIEAMRERLEKLAVKRAEEYQAELLAEEKAKKEWKAKRMMKAAREAAELEAKVAEFGKAEEVSKKKK